MAGTKLNWIKLHFQKHGKRSPWDFCWRTAIEGVVLSFVTVLVLTVFIKVEERQFMEWSVPVLLAVVLVVAPVLETLLLQAAPISIARLLKAGIKIQVLSSVTIFALLHFPEGIAVGIGAGLIGGFYLAFAYAHWAQKSTWKAMWITTVAHMLRNALAVTPLLMGKAFMS